MNNDIASMINLGKHDLPFYGDRLYFDGSQEEADKYIKRLEIRKRVYNELLDEFEVTDYTRKNRSKSYVLDEVEQNKLSAIENDPRWKYPLNDGVEPKHPRLYRSGAYHNGYEDFWIVDGLKPRSPHNM